MKNYIRKKLITFPLCVVFLISLQACSSVIPTPSTDIPQNNSDNSNTEADWILTPITYVEINDSCIGEEEGYLNGFKYLTIYFLAENNTKSFNYLPRIREDISISTQEGFTYLASKEISIYAGDSTRLIPPGFRIRGHIPAAYNTDSDGGNQLRFKVANGTKGYTVNIPAYPSIPLTNIPTSLSDFDQNKLFGGTNDGRIFGDEGINCMILGSAINFSSSLPTALPDSSYFDIGQTILADGESEITVVGFQRNGNHLDIDIQYKNSSAGYEKVFRPYLYIIGDDGYTRDGGSVSRLTIGPNQQKNFTHSFNVPENLSNIKLVFNLFLGENFDNNPLQTVINIK